MIRILWIFFFFNDTATTEIYTLSLHDALPIFALEHAHEHVRVRMRYVPERVGPDEGGDVDHGRVAGCGSRVAGAVFSTDRKSTRLNSSHANISYAVFCLKKKKQISLLSFATNI